MNNYCTCAFYDSDGGVEAGSPCTIHPSGCEHGKQWDEACEACQPVMTEARLTQALREYDNLRGDIQDRERTIADLQDRLTEAERRGDYWEAQAKRTSIENVRADRKAKATPEAFHPLTADDAQFGVGA